MLGEQGSPSQTLMEVDIGFARIKLSHSETPATSLISLRQTADGYLTACHE